MKTVIFGVEVDHYKEEVDLLRAMTYMFIQFRADQVALAPFVAECLQNGEYDYKEWMENNGRKVEELLTQKLIEGVLNKYMLKQLKQWTASYARPRFDELMYFEEKYDIDLIEDIIPMLDCLEINSARELSDMVKEYIVGQDEAIDMLSVPFFQHIESFRQGYTCPVKSSAIIMGPTGIGKSEILRRFGDIARKAGCPVIRINSNEVVPSAWKGLHITDIIARSLAEYSIDQLRYAVLIFHEADKLTHHSMRKVGSEDIDVDMIRDIMRLHETGHSLHLENGYNSDMSVNACQLPIDNLLIVFDGAFYGMDDIIKRRLNSGSMLGYGCSRGSVEQENILRQVTAEDMVAWGYPPELVGRIGTFCALNPLSEQTIYQIMLSAKENILGEHIKYCKRYNVELKFSDDALRYIANQAYNSGMGFRNVKTILSQCMNSLYYNLCAVTTESNPKVVEIDRDFVASHIGKYSIPQNKVLTR